MSHQPFEELDYILRVPKGTPIFKNLKMMDSYQKCKNEKSSTDGLYAVVEDTMYVVNYFSTASVGQEGRWVDAVGFTEGDQLWYAFPDTVYLCGEYI